MSVRTRHILVVGILLSSLGGGSFVRAQEDVPAPPTITPPGDDANALARREFLDGAALVRGERWGEALAAFERAAKLKPHAITTYNIAQCERAMGQFTRARAALFAALAQDEASTGSELAESVRVEGRGLVAELDRVLPRVTVTLKPNDAAIAVDGRPIERLADPSSASSGVPSFVAGSLAPGPGESPKVETFLLVTNPGAHVITVSRQGYQDVVLNRTFAAASTPMLDLELDRLPATIHVTSNLADAIVRVNGADVGNPPADVSRVAGRYRVVVTRKDFVTYEADFAVRPGEHVELTATMRTESKALTQKWWFWTAAGVLVAGAATGTYFLTRSDPAPQRTPTDGGGLGWSLRVP